MPANNVLHGVIAFCGKSGGLYYSKAYSPNFGLANATDPHNLSSLLFALQLNAKACSTSQASNAAWASGRPETSVEGGRAEPALRRVDMGATCILFYSPRECADLVVALFTDPSMGRGAAVLIEDIANRMCQRYRSQLDSTVGVRKFPGAGSLISDCLARLSEFFVGEIVSSVAEVGKVRWLCASCASGTWSHEQGKRAVSSYVRPGPGGAGRPSLFSEEEPPRKAKRLSKADSAFDGVVKQPQTGAESDNKSKHAGGISSRLGSLKRKSESLFSLVFSKSTRRKRPKNPQIVDSSLFSIVRLGSVEEDAPGSVILAAASEFSCKAAELAETLDCMNSERPCVWSVDLSSAHLPATVEDDEVVRGCRAGCGAIFTPSRSSPQRAEQGRIINSGPSRVFGFRQRRCNLTLCVDLGVSSDQTVSGLESQLLIRPPRSEQGADHTQTNSTPKLGTDAKHDAPEMGSQRQKAAIMEYCSNKQNANGSSLAGLRDLSGSVSSRQEHAKSGVGSSVEEVIRKYGELLAAIFDYMV